MNQRTLLVRTSLLLAVLLVVTFALSGLTSTPTTSAQDTPDGSRDSVSLTVYNQGTALVKDRRTFAFNAGENLINFTDVASTIDATSVSFKSLTNPETTVIEQNYVYDLVDTAALLERYLDQTITVTADDGTVYTGQLLSGRDGNAILRQENGEVVVLSTYSARDVRFPNLPDGLITRPTLRWLVSSPVDGDQQVELTYLAGGMSWTADYTVLLGADNTKLDLNGWITLTNTSGTGYKDAQLKLVAGDVNRIQSEVMYAMEESRAFDGAVAQAAPPVEQRDFYEYKLYEITRKVSVGNNETKQVEFVSGTGVPAKTFYVYDASYPFYGYSYPYTDQYYGTTGITTVSNYLEFSTGEDNGLGADLPAGRVRVYQEDVDGAALLIGENTIEHTPKGEDVQLYLGNAFDLVGERIQTDFRQVSSTVTQETFEIKLRNRKDTQAVEIRVPEHLSRWSDWEILSSSIPYTQLDSATIEYRTMVEPGAEVVITYTVQYVFP